MVLSRDHHDVSGTDRYRYIRIYKQGIGLHVVFTVNSPYRETSNIEDGSKFCAGTEVFFVLFFKFPVCCCCCLLLSFFSDMAIQNVIGDSFRGATWVAIHNGGGVGW